MTSLSAMTPSQSNMTRSTLRNESAQPRLAARFCARAQESRRPTVRL